MKKLKSHPLLEKVASIRPSYVLDWMWDDAPTSCQEFYDWYWDRMIDGCTNCNLCESRNFIVRPDGDVPAPIMVVGEGPGFLEDLTEIPLVGSMELQASKCSTCKKAMECHGHRVLKSPVDFNRKAPGPIVCKKIETGKYQLPDKFYLRSAGAIFDGILVEKWGTRFPRYRWLQAYNKSHPEEQLPLQSPWFITNSVLCRSYSTVRHKDTPPTNLQRRTCRQHLAFQWAACNPKVTLCLGQSALKSLMPSDKAAEAQRTGTVIQSKFGPVVYQAHPAHFMREERKELRAFGYAKVGRAMEIALEMAELLEPGGSSPR